LLGLALLSTAAFAQETREGKAGEATPRASTASYSQKSLLKNWAFSVCLAKVSKTPEAKEDANATAGAYMEFGKQPIEAYDALRELADRYARRTYGGAVQSEFNTMKCIDLLHSKELDALAGKWVRAAK
jgi:hypothetical protein